MVRVSKKRSDGRCGVHTRDLQVTFNRRACYIVLLLGTRIMEEIGQVLGL